MESLVHGHGDRSRAHAPQRGRPRDRRSGHLHGRTPLGDRCVRRGRLPRFPTTLNST